MGFKAYRSISLILVLLYEVVFSQHCMAQYPAIIIIMQTAGTTGFPVTVEAENSGSVRIVSASSNEQFDYTVTIYRDSIYHNNELLYGYTIYPNSGSWSQPFISVDSSCGITKPGLMSKKDAATGESKTSYQQFVSETFSGMMELSESGLTGCSKGKPFFFLTPKNAGCFIVFGDLSHEYKRYAYTNNTIYVLRSR